jgi:hypothetical protein
MIRISGDRMISISKRENGRKYVTEDITALNATDAVSFIKSAT